MRRFGLLAVSLVLVLVALATGPAAATPPPWPGTNPSADAKVRHEAVWIPAGDHRIPGILSVPKAGGAARSYPAVLMLHGFASQKDEVGDMYLREARALAARGIASLRIDFAGTGDSEQPYVENTLTGMVADAATAYDWLVAQRQTVDDRVGVLGFSLGAKVGLGLLAERPAAAFASWSGALYDGILQGFEGYYDEALENGSVVIDLGFAVVELSVAWFETMFASKSLSEAAGYRGPILAVAGTEDTVVDPSVSVGFIETLDTPDETLQLIEGADHIFHVLTPDQTFAERTIGLTADWFAGRL
jgi:dienelactone hydrolase